MTKETPATTTAPGEPADPPPPSPSMPPPPAYAPRSCADRGFHNWSHDEYYPPAAYIVALICFPCGILCCLKMKEVKCHDCAAETPVDKAHPPSPEQLALEARRDEAYRLGFAVGAFSEMMHPHSGG
ncbi:hypothetical protein DFJ73DRAFT_819322, partial [Zopfochytrium polystomum]